MRQALELQQNDSFWYEFGMKLNLNCTMKSWISFYIDLQLNRSVCILKLRLHMKTTFTFEDSLLKKKQISAARVITVRYTITSFVSGCVFVCWPQFSSARLLLMLLFGSESCTYSCQTHTNTNTFAHVTSMRLFVDFAALFFFSLASLSLFSVCLNEFWYIKGEHC